MSREKESSTGRQRELWLAVDWVPRSPGHFFYVGLGRPSLWPARYFGILILGYFEGLN